MFTKDTPRRGVVAGALLGLVAAPLAVLATSTPASAFPGAASTVFINEIHYDNDGTDVGEFVEIANPAGTDLTGWNVVLYNGSNGTSYGTTTLIGSTQVQDYAISGIQNGEPDGVALVDAGGAVVQFVSYEGSFAGTAGPAMGVTSTDIGVMEPGTTLAGESLQLTGTGATYGDFTWIGPADDSPGTANTGQTFTVAGGPAQPVADCGEGSLAVDTDASGSRDVFAVDADSKIITAEITSASVAGISLDDFAASTADGQPGTATLNVDNTTADGTYQVELAFDTDGVPAETATCTVTVVVSDQDAVTTISTIQGDGAASSRVGELVNVEAVVTSVITADDVTDGFFLQEEDADADADPATSEGIYVFCRNDCPADLSAGDQFRVSGEVAETFDTTQISAAFGNGSFTLLRTDAPLPTAAVVSLPADASTEDPTTFEHVEGMRTTISTTLAVSEYFNQARFGQIVLTANERDFQFTQTNEPSVDGYNAFLADLATRQIILDDDSNSQNAATSGPEDNEPYYYPTPGLRTSNYFRGGDTIADLTGVFEYSFGAWKLRPVAGADYTFEPTNPRPATPDEVGGRIEVASFNVLNYFATIGSSCGPGGNQDCRGADSEEERERQLDKIVAALATIDADVFGLIEIQNDEGLATQQIVDALNATTVPGTYDYIETGFIGTDAIKQAFLYKTATVTPIGEYETLTSADDPRYIDTKNRPALVQTFEENSTDERVTVAVNHFKSKGSDCGAGDDSPADGSGNCDGTRTAAAEALVDFLATDPTGSGDPDFLVIGDLNSYSQERPITALKDGGYVDLLERFEGLESYGYLFDGLLGHLDQGLATASLNDQVTGAGGWKINADENPLFDYNDTVQDAGERTFERESSAKGLYQSNPYRSSDHDPVVVGLDLASPSTDPTPIDPVKIQVLATNDFHGRIANDPFSASAGAAVLAGAVKQLRAANPNTTFAAAGDLIGASTFESFVANDKPTIDALNEAGLDVSAVGNHEFDQGYDDLVDRVIAPFDATTNPDGGAEWKYLGANVKFKASGDPALDGTWMKTQGGVQIGYIGAVTEQLPSLVSPDGISQIEVTDIVAATNTAADNLEAAGADVIVLLVHEGAPTTDCSAINNLGATTDFGSIVKGVNDKVDAIVSGHTHLAYNCSFPVDGWSGRPVTERPVVSAGQYGANLNQLVFTVDPTTGVVQAKTQAILKLKAANGGPFNYPVDGPTQDIVDAAVANAAVLGAEPLGTIEGPFLRAKLADGTTENRGGESTLGNLVAEIQQDATEDATFGSAQIAFMNPGGLRADLLGTDGDYPRTVTFKQAANVQPFANTLVNEDLTGTQIEEALEQQWQPAGSSRPFLKLGISEGFTYTYDASQADGERIQAMYLAGEPIDLAATYSVTVNSFLAAGGDNFPALNGAGRKQDTGRTDLQAQVDYFAEFASDAPLPVDYSQRAVGVVLPIGAPTAYGAGDDVVFDLTSLSMTGPGDPTDSSVDVILDGASLGSFPVTTTPLAALPGDDEAGTASVTVTLPGNLTTGDYELLVTGSDTGTEVIVPIKVEGEGVGTLPSTTKANVVPGKIEVFTSSLVLVKVTAEGETPTGQVEIRNGKELLKTRTLANGTVSIPTGRLTETGIYTLKVRYLGDDVVAPSRDRVTVKVVKQSPNLILRAPNKVDEGSSARVKAVLKGINAEVTGKIVFKFAGDKIVRNLKNGKAAIMIGKLKKTTTVNVVYRGDGEFFKKKIKKTTIRVR